VELALAVVAARRTSAAGDTAIIREVAELESRRACEEARVRTDAMLRRERSQAAADARRWLDDELRKSEEEAARACAEAQAVAGRCATLAPAKPEPSCMDGRQDATCRLHREQLLDSSLCEVDQARAARVCQERRGWAYAARHARDRIGSDVDDDDGIACRAR
jgi:hypothetical protein